MFQTRSTKLERIDTGDYTPEEYAVFLTEIAFINKYLGDRRALKKTLFRDIAREWRKPARSKSKLAESDKNRSIDSGTFSVLDVGCGSGELLRYMADFARSNGKRARLVGIDINEISASVTASESRKFPEISAIRSDAFHLPFADNTFDYAISSLFFHHLTDDQIPHVLKEMSRVARRGTT
jgi:ubiquinone/menaquinone biosynthesis C-methylase UbiE